MRADARNYVKNVDQAARCAASLGRGGNRKGFTCGELTTRVELVTGNEYPVCARHEPGPSTWVVAS